MVSTSENSFGAKLRKGQDIVVYISGYNGYAPPRSQESVQGMTTLLNSIITTNTTETAQKENYKVAIDARQLAFSKKSGSIDKLLSPIKGAVEAQYGKKSSEAVSLNSIIKKMRSTKLTKAPADPTKESKKNTISQSERSFGSRTQFFNDIVTNLTQFPGFNPSSATIKIASLQATAAQVTSLNNAVVQKTQQLKTTQATRIAQYAELNDRVQRIKAYVKAQYGINSVEYNQIKGLSI